MTWYHPALAQRALDEGDRELASLKAENERLRSAIETVAKTFEKDIEQGFKTRDKEFAITILRAAVPRS